VQLSRIVITSGEPAGIGPDLCLKIAQRDWPCDLVCAADAALLADRAQQIGVEIAISPYHAQSPRAPARAGTLRVCSEKLDAPVEAGRLDSRNAKYVLRLLERALAGCLNSEFDAMVTAPVQKSVIADAGIRFMGHTEFLAERTGAPHPVMMLVADRLRVALATTHVPLAAVSRALDTGRLVRVMAVIDADLRARFGFARPRILVCGLNPHAGESGHLGREEIEIIAPAVEEARRQGIDATGPTPADTAFTPRSLAGADVVLAMYHDQGLPVLKYAGFGTAVNVTLGLTIIRTSVDHGTALTLAGSGQADESSLAAALEQALALTRTRA
jgi:4-hydroxythreonine-4-phosphate dehydrogenase